MKPSILMLALMMILSPLVTTDSAPSVADEQRENFESSGMMGVEQESALDQAPKAAVSEKCGCRCV